MARLSVSGTPIAPDRARELSNLILKLQGTLLHPDEATEQRLIASADVRNKVAANLGSARQLLLRVEQDAATLKVQSKKAEVQARLLAQRDQLEELEERLQELEDYEHETDLDSTDFEDLLGDDTPSDDTHDNSPLDHQNPDLTHSTTFDRPFVPPKREEPSQSSPQPQIQPQKQEALPPSEPTLTQQRDTLLGGSTLRARNGATLPLPQGLTSSSSATASSPDTLSAQESLLTHHRTEQEALTSSLLSMATRLKESTQAFSTSLSSEDEILKRATDGLDKNVGGLEAASAKMGVLRRMSEGRGWFGRMGLYAGIFGLWVVAILVVGVLPKLRF